jgi:hypothetical protein
MSSSSLVELLPSASKPAQLEDQDENSVQIAICEPEDARVDTPQEIWVSLTMSWAGKNFEVEVAESDRCVMA